ncbi:Alpha/Beta hydrolase protein [Crepidotus variabilis]|uniref:Alpha/Beta hydrolase protein n=1 Tax=Crepidotus variabilis TaxID=179855 RepID=A0A9P6ENC6_9AGAR|nr:Alpha/Beta hydrolase protein [Crepidotus variabilis]
MPYLCTLSPPTNLPTIGIYLIMGALVSVLVLVAMAGFFFNSFPGASARDEEPEVRFAEKPALLQVRKHEDSDEVEEISMKELLETRCKSLFKPFKPMWWLGNGHLQTIYCVMGDFSKRDLMWYHRTYLTLADGGTLGLDFAPADHSNLKEDTPIVVVQHGLTGGSYEPYVRAVLSKACAPVEAGGLGYRAVVVNFRGCAGIPITSPLLYSACHTDDTREALRHVAHLYPKAPLLGLGFSLGSNVVTRYLGEEGELTRLHAACTLACPWDLKQNNEELLASFTGRHVYSKAMGGNLLRLLKRHVKSILQHPNEEVTAACHQALKLKNPTLDKFDDTFTRVAGGPGPHFPFRNSDDYYIWGSSHKIVDQITVPYLGINAADDPVVRFVPMEGGGNGLVAMELTRGGGHLGWFQYGKDGSVDRWTTEPVLEWLKLMGTDVVHDPKPRGSEIYVDEEGFLRERAHPRLGCKVKEGGGLIDGNGGEEGMIQGL